MIKSSDVNEHTNIDVIIIGGGATGIGIARDCVLRGLTVCLLERHDLAAGATGRNHGLLHSGGRYAVYDQQSARECIQENRILRTMASHCIEDTSGLFITLPEDCLDYQKQFVEACLGVGIEASYLTPSEAILLEPSVNPNLIGAVKVPDGAIDPFRLVAANMLDVVENGGKILTYHEVTSLIIEQERVIGVRAIDHKNKKEVELYAQIVVNAAGIWGQRIAEYADLNVNMLATKGSLLIFEHRINRCVINRCRKSADADILVPADSVSLIGTTSITLPYDQIDNLKIMPSELELLLNEGEKLAPMMRHTRILRSYAGVRPLIAHDADAGGREISRSFVILDHQSRDGLQGFITIAGGKLITYRLMAEKVTDLICHRLSKNKSCITISLPLPGSRSLPEKKKKRLFLPPIIRLSAHSRHGELADKLLSMLPQDKRLICECEGVSVGEIDYAIDVLNIKNLIDLRRRTRLGMGSCQGTICACRASQRLEKKQGKEITTANDHLKEFLQERWQGIEPVAWGHALRESELTSWLYQCVGGLSDE